MRSIIYQLLANLFKRRNIQVSLLLAFVAIGIFSTLSYQNFFYLQAQNIDQLSVFNEILKPLSGLVLVTQILMISIATSQLLPNFFERGQQSLVLNSSLSNISLSLTLVFTVLVFSLIPLCYFLLVGFGYYLSSYLDGWLLVTTSLALFLGSLLYALLLVAVSLLFKKTLSAMIFTITITLLLFGIDEFLRTEKLTEGISIYLNLFLHLRSGLIVSTELIRIMIWMLVCFSTIILVMDRLRLSSGQKGMALLLFSISLLLSNWLIHNGLFNDRLFSKETIGESILSKSWDISREKLNSFSDDIASKISKIEESILITAVIDDETNHDEIRQAFESIKQHHDNSSLTFSSRQALAVNSQINDQFVIIKIGNQQQTIRYPFDRPAKESISQMIIQLTSRGDQWITFIEGHDEASPFGKTNRDISSFYHSLKELGWSVALQNLAKQNFISENTKVLVIAATKKEWLPKELDTVMAYLKRGGNLLVLHEQNDSFPQELRNYLAVKINKGILIDWQGYQSGTPHPAILIINEFSPHPINTNINSLLAFPWSVGLELDADEQNKNNEYKVILQTHKGVWNEFNSEQTELSLNEKIGEQRKIFNLAYSIENEALQQRMIVVGDSSFLSDSAINNYANRQFSLNLISWLTAKKIDVSGEKNQDNFIRTTPFIHFLFKWLFSVILPGLFLVAILVLQFTALQLKKSKPIMNKSER